MGYCLVVIYRCHETVYLLANRGSGIAIGFLEKDDGDIFTSFWASAICQPGWDNNRPETFDEEAELYMSYQVARERVPCFSAEPILNMNRVWVDVDDFGDLKFEIVKRD